MSLNSNAGANFFAELPHYSEIIGRRESTMTVSSQNSQSDGFSSPPKTPFRSSCNLYSDIGSHAVEICREQLLGASELQSHHRAGSSSRPVLRYTTHYSDSGFGSTMSSGSSCSYLPPPPPYRVRSKQHKIHRSLSDSKYCSGSPLEMTQPLEDKRQERGLSWTSNVSLSPSPSMSTVSCPEYPELQEKLHRLAMARDSLSLQVAILTEQVGAQKEKIRDLESLLAQKRNNLTSTEELLQDNYHRMDDCAHLESKKLDLMAEVSSLKLKYAALEREKNETERKLRVSKNEMDHVSQSMHGMVVQQQLHQLNGHSPMPPLAEHKVDEMEQLRTTVHRLMADNEQKNMQIHSLRSALDEQIRQRHVQEELYTAPRRWDEAPQYDLNAQIRRLLMEEPVEQMPHSTSFPVSLCSSSLPGNQRSTVQSSSSFTSSLSAASPQSSWSHGGTPRHQLHPTGQFRNDSGASYRSPSSPAARQLAAELDELRRVGDMHSSKTYSSASLPRGMGTKASSTLAIPAKKLSIASGTSVGELRSTNSVCSVSRRKNFRSQMNRWLSGKLRSKRATSAPNLVESDDEVARSRNSVSGSHASSTNLKSFRRDRTRSSLRNLFSKLTRSTSQDQNAFRRGTAARSTSTARLVPVQGAIALRPPLSQFIEWRSEQLAEWISEVGFPEYAGELNKHVRSGRQLLGMNATDYENVIGIRNPLHRKRLALLLRRIEDDFLEPSSKWDVHQTSLWLEEIGLPQFKDIFVENLIDGPMLLALTAADMIEMRITNAHHYTAIARSIQYLKMVDFKFGCLERRFDPNLTSRYPCPEAVVRWSHSATCEWLKKIDLAEFTPNLLCAGTPGALMVYEPSFTAETLAEILQMPPHKTLLRRHLTSHFNQLLGQKIIAEKRDYLASSGMPQLIPSLKVKVVRKGFSLTRKKSKHELCLDQEELLCPPQLNHSYPSKGDTSSLESSNV